MDTNSFSETRNQKPKTGNRKLATGNHLATRTIDGVSCLAETVKTEVNVQRAKYYVKKYEHGSPNFMKFSSKML
jgi:hypothetical protein